MVKLTNKLKEESQSLRKAQAALDKVKTAREEDTDATKDEDDEVRNDWNKLCLSFIMWSHNLRIADLLLTTGGGRG